MEHMDRKTFIGGSDMAAVLGLSRFKSACQLYAEKTGQIEMKNHESEAMYWGKVLEESVRKEFEKQTGLHVESGGVYQHPKYDFCKGHVDGYIPSENAILEIKCVSSYNRRLWRNDAGQYIVPVEYLIQAAYYCELSGAKRIYFAVLFGGHEFKKFHIDYTGGFKGAGESLIPKAVEFWKRIQTKNPPTPISKEDAFYAYPIPDKRMSLATIEIEEKCRQYAEVYEQIKELKDDRSSLRLDLMNYLKNSEYLISVGGKILATWKTWSNGTRRLTVKGMGKK